MHLEEVRRLIDRHEASLDRQTRKSTGAHYTPHTVAELLVSASLDRYVQRCGALPNIVADMSCGAGSFLVVVADQLVDRGLDPIDVISNRVVGFDIDEAAVHTARRALREWFEVRTGEKSPTEARVQTQDVLDTSDWNAVDAFDLVIGNPPFLTQLRSATALGPTRLAALSDEFGRLDQYVDASAVFLLLAVRAVRAGGLVCLILPQSFLSMKGAMAVREYLRANTEVLGLWGSPNQLFDASVRVCAVWVSPSRGDESESGTQVEVVWSGAKDTVEPTTVYKASLPPGASSWGPIMAPALGVPSVVPSDGLRLGTLADATAGFRDEYYALRDACVEQSAAEDGIVSGGPLITVGMIRPCGSNWGSGPARIGGRQWMRPSIDESALSLSNPRVAGWVVARALPKVLVATQTRVVEAMADESGTAVPMTPVISVEPRPGWQAVIDPEHRHGVDLWWIVAALSAPAVSAVAVSENLGSGLSAQSLRWSAKALRDVVLPGALDLWAQGAQIARELSACAESDRAPLLDRLGRVMLEAHGQPCDSELFEWWYQRAVRA